jgi:hypothetical protein
LSRMVPCPDQEYHGTPRGPRAVSMFEVVGRWQAGSMVASRRLRAVAALTGGVLVVGAPSLSARLTGTRVPLREVVRGELAGSGSALLQVTGGDRQVLATHRHLAVADNAFVAAYTVPLLLGISLLSAPGRPVGLGLTVLAAASDLTENAALVRALSLLAGDPARPTIADRPARRARRAALIKFAALIPAAGLALWGTTGALRPGPERAVHVRAPAPPAQ